MEFVPWTSFARIVDRYGGDAGVRRLNCAEQFRVMAFAQLTWRESLRDIEVTLGAHANKRYAMGLRHAVHRATLADANEARDWRLWSDVAALLIRRARRLYRDDDLGLELTNTVYALDATTIDLCPSLFDWAPFRSTKAAVKLHTLLDLCGAIPAFIHVALGQPLSDGKMGGCQRARYIADRGGRVLRHGSRLPGLCAVVPTAPVGCLLCDARQTRDERPAGVLDFDRPNDWRDVRSAHCAEWLLRRQGLSRAGAAYPFQRSRVGKDVDIPDQQHNPATPDHRCPLQASLAGRTGLQVDQAAFAHQEIPGHQRERGEDANGPRPATLVRRVHLCADRHRQKGAPPQCLALYVATDFVGLGIRENPAFMRLAARFTGSRITHFGQPIEFVQFLTGHY